MRWQQEGESGWLDPRWFEGVVFLLWGGDTNWGEGRSPLWQGLKNHAHMIERRLGMGRQDEMCENIWGN